MALWQFELDLIPSDSARVSGVDAVRMTREQLDAIQLSIAPTSAAALYEGLTCLMPEKSSWSQDLRIWGDEKTDDAQIWFEEDKIEFVQFRLNMADLSLTLLRGLCTLARQLDCVFADRSGAIIQPTNEAVLRQALQSKAARFVKNPQAYLEAAVRADQAAD